MIEPTAIPGSPQLLSARVRGPAPGEAYVAVAQTALEAGFDTPGTLRLAIQDPPFFTPDLGRILVEMLRECDVRELIGDDALILHARVVAARIVSGELPAVAGAAEICQVITIYRTPARFAAGATVYVTGRSTRAQRSEYGRPETIEETAELVEQAGGKADRRAGRPSRSCAGAGARRAHRAGAGTSGCAGQRRVGRRSFCGVERARVGALARQGTASAAAGDRHAHHHQPLRAAAAARKQGGLLVEITDGTAQSNSTNYRLSLFYDLAKTSVLRIGWAQGQELKPHGCTAVAVTPGWLRPEMMLDAYGVTQANWRDATAKQPHFVITETPRYVGRAVAHLAADSNVARWNGQSLSSGQLAKVYGFTDLDGSQPDAWRYLVEVQDPGKPADATGYR
jgi:NAD(P)-dependent dehydrogenase (short-subunit alcohol dehydrogenase family)